MIAFPCYNQSDMISQDKKERHIDIKFFSDNEELLFQDVLHPSGEKENDKQLLITNTIFHLNDQQDRKFVLLDANKVEELKQKEAIMEAEKARILQLQDQMKYLMRVIENVQRRTSLHHYNPGVFQQLTLNAENNNLYKIHGNFLLRRPEKSKNGVDIFQEPLSKGIISNQRIDETMMHFSFKIKITDTSDEKVRAFIGLCTKIPQGIQLNGRSENNMFKFITPKGSPEKIEEQGRILKAKKESLCDIYYYRQAGLIAKKDQRFQTICLKKGDAMVLTVNLEQSHLTWYRNETCIERSFFENPHTNIYPFVYLQPNLEAEL